MIGVSSRVEKMVRIAAVAALYTACTLVFSPLSFGPVQFRFSELLMLLCFFKKEYGIALALGCALANLFSPMGFYDVLFGTLATALSAVCMYRCRRLLPATLFPTLFCVIIGVELYTLTGAPLAWTTLTVMLGECTVVTVIGYPLMRVLQKNRGFARLAGIDAKERR